MAISSLSHSPRDSTCIQTVTKFVRLMRVTAEFEALYIYIYIYIRRTKTRAIDKQQIRNMGP